MGYRPGVTKVDDLQKREIEDGIEHALTFIDLRSAGLRIPVAENDSTKVVLASGTVFKSANLAAMLRNCEEVFLMAATAGSEIIEAIVKDTERGRLTRGVILDAVASEMVDASLDWIADYYNRQVRRENRRLTKRRFSCGYGNFAIENQKTIHDILELNTIGITITENFILVPEKSVTAVAGIRGMVTGDQEGEEE